MDARQSYYDVLRVSPSASADEIKRAYRAAVIRSHSDLHPNDPAAEERTKAINEAYETLSDPVKRNLHDQRLSESEYGRPHASFAQDWDAEPNKLWPGLGLFITVNIKLMLLAAVFTLLFNRDGLPQSLARNAAVVLLIEGGLFALFGLFIGIAFLRDKIWTKLSAILAKTESGKKLLRLLVRFGDAQWAAAICALRALTKISIWISDAFVSIANIIYTIRRALRKKK
jgi:hypothetical protein